MFGDCKFHEPVYIGDTLRAESEVIAKRESRSNSDNHIITWQTKGYKQNDELVVEFVRSNLFIDGFLED